MIKKFSLMTLLLFSLITVTSAATRVVKQAKGFTGNPTLSYYPLAGDRALSVWVGNFLRLCDWFKVQPTGRAATYAVKGSAGGGILTLTVYNQTGLVWFRVNEPITADRRATAARAVDKIINKIFRVPGICNSKIIFSARTGRKVSNIYSCGIEGGRGKIRRLTAYHTLCVEPEWFPDGKSIVYTRYATDRTYIMQTTVGQFVMSRILAAYSGTNAGAAISPNGKYMAFTASRGRMVDLYIKAVGRRARRQLTSDQAVDATPCWSPRGGTICFVSNRRTGHPRLWLIPANGGRIQRLPTIGSEAISPTWSRNNIIAYTARMGKNYTIATLDLAHHSAAKILIRAAGSWESPSWAPDGRHLVCTRIYRGRSMLYIIDSWTGKARLLLRGVNDFSMPNWSPLL